MTSLALYKDTAGEPHTCLAPAIPLLNGNAEKTVPYESYTYIHVTTNLCTHPRPNSYIMRTADGCSATVTTPSASEGNYEIWYCSHSLDSCEHWYLWKGYSSIRGSISRKHANVTKNKHRVTRILKPSVISSLSQSINSRVSYNGSYCTALWTWTTSALAIIFNHFITYLKSAVNSNLKHTVYTQCYCWNRYS